MEEFVEMSVQKYRDIIIGNHVKLKDAKTPSLLEGTDETDAQPLVQGEPAPLMQPVCS